MTEAPYRFAHVFGLRLLFNPQWRGRVLRATAVFFVLGYFLLAPSNLILVGRLSPGTDFIPYYDAAAAVVHGTDPYAPFLQACHGAQFCPVGYIYPPLVAMLLTPLTALPVGLAEKVWVVLSQAALVAAALILWRAIKDHVTSAAVSWLMIGTVLFAPLHWALFSTQVTPFLVLLLAWATAMYAARQPDRSGAAIGAAIALRISPVVVVPAYLRQPRAIVVIGASCIAFTAIPMLVTPYTAEYFTRVLPRLAGSSASVENVSLVGTAVRALSAWGVSAPGTVVSIVVNLVVLLPTAWLGLRRDGDVARRAAVMAAFVATMPLVSSYSWNHHMITEVVVYAALAPALCRPRMRLPLALGLAAYPLLSIHHDQVRWLQPALGLDHPSGWSVVPYLLVTSLNAIGMVSLWLAALTAVRQLDRSTPPEPVLDASALKIATPPAL